MTLFNEPPSDVARVEEERIVGALIGFLIWQGCTPEEVFKVHLAILDTLETVRRRQGNNDAGNAGTWQ